MAKVCQKLMLLLVFLNTVTHHHHHHHHHHQHHLPKDILYCAQTHKKNQTLDGVLRHSKYKVFKLLTEHLES